MTDVNKHWILKYIGIDWSDEYNCFDHFCQVQKDRFDRDIISGLSSIPDFEERSEALAYIKSEPSIKKRWFQYHYPQIQAKEGDAVLFGAEGYTFHIGTFIYSNGIKGVLHCDRKQGVCLTAMYKIDTFKNSPIFMRYNNA